MWWWPPASLRCWSVCLHVDIRSPACSGNATTCESAARTNASPWVQMGPPQKKFHCQSSRAWETSPKSHIIVLKHCLFYIKVNFPFSLYLLLALSDQKESITPISSHLYREQFQLSINLNGDTSRFCGLENAPEWAVTTVPSWCGWNQQLRIISDGFWRSFLVCALWKEHFGDSLGGIFLICLCFLNKKM